MLKRRATKPVLQRMKCLVLVGGRQRGVEAPFTCTVRRQIAICSCGASSDRSSLSDEESGGMEGGAAQGRTFSIFPYGIS